MKQSVSSVLAARIKQRRAVSPAKRSVRFVTFSPDEMAYDIPEGRGQLVPVGRGPGAIFNKPSKKEVLVRLEPDVAKVFKDSGAVNMALRKLIEAMPARTTSYKRKTG